MDPRVLVRPLEDEWQSVLDAALRPLSTKDVAKLGPRVGQLSEAYNTGQAEGRRTKVPLDARVAFSFPRDVPKGAAAVRELVVWGLLRIPDERPLRILDLGAGLGAMTWGVARALAASGAKGRIEALLVDEDAGVLGKAETIARHAPKGEIDVRIQTRVAGVGPMDRAYDLVIVGQVLSEIEPHEAPEARLEKHAALVSKLLETNVAPEGSLVIVEPALRDRTRHLHALRDRVVERGATIFAPCLHASPCPSLAAPGEWCHEDLEVDLPPWVVPLARAAGLRFQGLTFSYLVLRRDGTTLASARNRHSFRVVSNLLRTKGKAELVTCGADGVRKRIRQLDRDASENDGFRQLRRGDVVTLDGEIDNRGRVGAGVQVSVDVAAARK